MFHKTTSNSKKDLETENGFEITSVDKAQRVVEKTDEIVRIRAAQQSFPNNRAFRKAEQRRLMQLLDLTPQEAEEIEAEEIENAERALEAIEAGTPAAPPGAPEALTELPAPTPSNTQPAPLSA